MDKKEISKSAKLPQKLEGYGELLRDIQSILQRGLSKAYQAVDNLKVQTYWQIGERIVREELAHKERADYGKRVIQQLAIDLRISRSLIFEIVQFYRAYSIVHALHGQLSWTHYRLLSSIQQIEERQFYEVQTIRNGWSYRELEHRIKSKEYENAKKIGAVISKLPVPLPAPEDVFKNTYNWDFIELEEKHSEHDLEQALLNNIQQVLLEFGKGFAFVARQQKVLIAGQWEKIDLLFYHYFLKCFIIVDLKARELRRGDIEQVTRYLTYYRDHKIESDRDPIALIICKSHNKIDVYYSAGKDRDDIFVAEYKTKLPSEDEIKKRLRKIK
jgi:predicted nuclease of restriction endonuclease-like (RecB) superfamily